MSQADPFREIVKANAALYRDTEETRERAAVKNSNDLNERKIQDEVYVRAVKCFSIAENADIKQIGIYDERPLSKHVDISHILS